MAFSIKTKIITTTLIILFVGIFICFIVINLIYINEHFKVLKTNAIVLSYNLKFKIEKLLHLGLELTNIEGFNKQCKELVENYGTISTAMVLNTKGEILYYYYDPKKTDFYNYTEAEKLFIRKSEILKDIETKNIATRTIKVGNSFLFELFIPFFDERGIVQGFIGVSFPYRVIVEHIKKLFIIVFFIILLTFVIAVVILVTIISRTVTNPLKNLVNVIQKIRENNSLDMKVEILTEDEIGQLASAFNLMLKELEENKKKLIEKNIIEKELEIARKIQTAILPKKFIINGYEITAFMKTAEEVGGDYYDIISTSEEENWISIGDVTGHGISAGLIMMMLQVIFSTLVNINSNFKKSPEKLYNLSNKVLFDNIKNRMYLNQYVTACFLRVFKDGLIEYAGAHEYILVYRTQQKRVEILETDGLWLGMLSDISNITKISSVKLNKGDLIFLYTDGLIQIKNKEGEQYSLERLILFIEKNGELELETIKHQLIKEIEEFKGEQDDDISFVILRKK